eukprot:7279314-Prymnesium_polylepis.4
MGQDALVTSRGGWRGAARTSPSSTAKPAGNASCPGARPWLPTLQRYSMRRSVEAEEASGRMHHAVITWSSWSDTYSSCPKDVGEVRGAVATVWQCARGGSAHNEGRWTRANSPNSPHSVTPGFG